MSKNENLQRAWHEYQRSQDHLPSSARAAAEWAVTNGLCPLPKIDPLDVLADQMSRALREEYFTDPRGRRVRRNHAIKVTRNGVQLTFWGVMGFASHEHMERAFTQRREQIVGDAAQLKTDVDAYNDMRKEGDQIVLDLDFTEDVAEREVAAEMIKARPRRKQSPDTGDAALPMAA